MIENFRFWMAALGLLLGQWFCAVNGFAVTVAPVNHATLDSSLSPNLAYWAVKGTDAPECDNVVVAPGITVLDPATAGQRLVFSVANTTSLTTLNSGVAPTTGSEIVIRAEYNGGSGYQPIALTGESGTSYNNVNNAEDVSYGIVEGATRYFGISFQDITRVATTDGLCTKLGACVAGTSGNGTTATIRIGLVKSGSTLSNGATVDYTDFRISLVDCPPHSAANILTAPGGSLALVPGDKRMKILNATTAPTDGVPMKSVIVYGTTVSGQVTPANASITLEYQGTANAVYTIENLTNETRYCFGIGYANKGGIVGFSSSGSTSTTTIPNVQCATPSQLEGFLGKSTCFVATAAFGDESHPYVQTLHHFRDHVLLRSSLGRLAALGYYRLSPPLAKWVGKSNLRRWAARVLLWPLVQAARAMLYFQNEARADDVEPYIESLRKKHGIRQKVKEPDTAPAQVATPSSAPITVVQPSAPVGADQVQPYLEKIRRENGVVGTSTPSSPEKVQPYIESVQQGHDLEPKYRGKVRHAFGFSVAATNTFNVQSTEQANAFSEIYNTDGRFVPSADLFYEYQVMRNPYAGSLGPYGRIGFMMLKGQGVFVRSGQSSEDTKFRFYAVPVTIGASYRFTQGRFVVPFLQGGLTWLPYWETRDDNRPTRRGNSRALTGLAGVAWNLDWIGRKNAWDLYDAHGILHSYIVTQFEATRTFSGAVRFNHYGFFAGLAFEY